VKLWGVDIVNKPLTSHVSWMQGVLQRWLSLSTNPVTEEGPMIDTGYKQASPSKEHEDALNRPACISNQGKSLKSRNS
jgi:hypothetical protein